MKNIPLILGTLCVCGVALIAIIISTGSYRNIEQKVSYEQQVLLNEVGQLITRQQSEYRKISVAVWRLENILSEGNYDVLRPSIVVFQEPRKEFVDYNADLVALVERSKLTNDVIDLARKATVSFENYSVNPETISNVEEYEKLLLEATTETDVSLNNVRELLESSISDTMRPNITIVNIEQEDFDDVKISPGRVLNELDVRGLLLARLLHAVQNLPESKLVKTIQNRHFFLNWAAMGLSILAFLVGIIAVRRQKSRIAKTYLRVNT